MRVVWASAVVVALCASARADDKPWAAGVSKVEQQLAFAIYNDANTDFTESRYAEALAKYREAVKHWNHPAIRFNMAVSLINLERPVEAYEHLEAALKYGAAALGDDAYAKGLAYKQKLDAELARLRVTSDVDGVDVTLDGQPLIHGRGDVTRRLVPGEHQVVATKPGYLTQTTKLALASGAERVHLVELVAIPEKVVHRTNTAPAWIVVGAGGALALAGLGAHVFWYKPNLDRLRADAAADNVGQYRRDEGPYDTSRVLTIGLYAASAITIGAGVVLRYTVFRQRRESPVVSIVPARGGGMVSVAW